MSELWVNTFKNENGNGAPDFPNGITVTGVVTSTTLNATVAGDLTVTGDIGCAGTITYEDVARVDATGISTFREGFKVGPLTGIGLTAYNDGSIRTSGIVTATSFTGSGANLTGFTASQIPYLNAAKIATGIVTATRLGGGTASNTKYLRGDGIWDTVTGTTINNNANDRLITGSGTANTLEGESTLTYGSNNVEVNISGNGGYKITAANHAPQIRANANRSSTGNTLLSLHADWNNNSVAMIDFQAGSDTTNKDDGKICFYTRASGSSMSLAATFGTDGHLTPGGNNSFDLGSAGLKWRNLYTNDLNLSNEGSSNDIDGTWGDYKIQEGESDLFLINNRNGKKYKFNLTEVN